MALIQTVHLSMANFKSAPVVPAVQNDTDRQIKMVIDDFDLTEGLTGKITFVRSDGTHYESAATLDTATNSFTADIDQALTQPGRTLVQLKVTDTQTVSTFSFVIFVEADNSGTVTPQEGIDLVTAVEAAEDAADRAEDAAAMFDEDVQGYVHEWLDDHPEATTSVLDHSLTYIKLVNGTLGFVTPEMFGAVGDGVTDDSMAIQEALNSGFAVVAKSRNYKIGSSLVVSGYYRNIDFTNSTIEYTGTDSAIIIQGVSGMVLGFGRINAIYGNGIEFRADSTAHKSQYVKLSFLAIQTGGKGVWFNVSNDGWSNEISIYGGVFVSSGDYGIYINNNPNDANYSINSLKFYNIAAEVSGSFKHYYVNSPSYTVDGITIFYPRYYEYYTSTIITTVGNVQNINFYGTNYVKLSRFDFSSATKRTYLHVPVENEDETVFLGDSAKYHNGEYTYLHYSGGTTQASGALVQSATAGEVIYRKNGNIVSVNVVGFKSSSSVGELLKTAIGSDYRPMAIISFLLYGGDGTVARAFCRTNGLIGSTALTANVEYNGSCTYIV